MTKAKIKTGRALLRPVRYSLDLVEDGKPKIILVEGHFHQWFVDAKTQLLAVVEAAHGFIVLIPFDEIEFID